MRSSSAGAGAGAYLRILRVPRVAWLVLVTALSRLPVGLNPLAVVLFVSAETGSYTDAGLVAGALSLGTAVAQPFVSRLVDGRGAGIMVPISAGHGLGLAGVLVAGGAGAPVAVLVACALVAGLALPPTSSVLRASWPRLLADRPELLPAAYALDAVLVQISFLTGPLLVAALAVALDVQAALVLSAVTGLAATAAFVALVPAVPPRRGATGLLGPLTAPGIQTLVASQVPVGVAFGSMQVVLPAFAETEGRQEAAGVLLALLSAASITGALVFGARRRRRPLHEVHVRFAVLVPVGIAPLALASSVPLMAVLVLPAGALLSAFFATRNELAGVAAPPGMGTEAVTWPLTALIAGNALGAALAGAVADAAGWRTAVAVAVAAAALGSAVVGLRLATLRPRAP
jgi:MFS family permease